MTVTPIRLEYGGITFRSSLEADWACTLDQLGIEWMYEPQKFTLMSGIRYIPDFWLPEIGTWIEVKGEGVPGIEKARQLAAEVLCYCQGRCQCQWYGGQIVLIGRSPYAGLIWRDALDLNTYLASCARCKAYSWRRIRHSLRCRKCGEQYDTYRDGSLLSASECNAIGHAPRTQAAAS